LTATAKYHQSRTPFGGLHKYQLRKQYANQHLPSGVIFLMTKSGNLFSFWGADLRVKKKTNKKIKRSVTKKKKKNKNKKQIIHTIVSPHSLPESYPSPPPLL
jgi:hypothetical protein